MPIPISMDATWLNPSSVQYNAQELRQADSTMFNGDGTAFGVRGGIVRHGDLSLDVSVNSSDVVTIQPGAVVIPGNSGVGNGCYRCALSASTTGTLAARNATNPRISLVIFRALDTDVVGTHGAYTGRIEFVDGTPAASPVAPALPVLAVELARITVPATGAGNATIDNTFRQYVASVGGRLAVPSQTKLPAADATWDRAFALDTGTEYEWNGTAWVPTVMGLIGAWRVYQTTWTTTSTTYVVCQNATERTALTTSLVKARAGTRLEVHAHCSASVLGGAGQRISLGLRIGGTDYDIGQRFNDTTSSERMDIQGHRIITGVPVGTYTVEPVWKINGATLQSWVSDDMCSYMIREVV